VSRRSQREEVGSFRFGRCIHNQMSSKRWVSALLFAAMAFSSANTQTKATENLSADTPDFSKEAYVVERLSSRIKLENDGTGTRE
jgi:hypothetical protein